MLTTERMSWNLMCHVLFEFSGIPIYSYWFFYGLGLCSAVLLVVWLAHCRSVDLRKVGLLAVAGTISAVVFARLSAVLYGTRFSDLLNLQKSGQISFGASFGALFVIILLAKQLKFSIAEICYYDIPKFLSIIFCNFFCQVFCCPA